MIYIAAAGWPAGITAKALAGEIGAACKHFCLFHHEKMVLHQAAAPAAVFGVFTQWKVCRLEFRHGITVKGLVRSGGAAAIAVGKAVQLMPALTLSWV